MKLRIILILTAAVLILTTRGSVDADEAVVYPAQVDQSWVDAKPRSLPGADEAVVYVAKVDQSWVDAEA
ncbi:hypothetical protein EYZ11_007149 [Aspergillus tanneri]|uniref:Uncharacterized protein n=1 Tax=Aspergillus tanneri TaxID=1220188 RepID=A0A4S3JFX5_9EURO|nr:uncharacterized protein ATNIH1004_001817 [Aspergillus tanneri]KAA8652908.1 hypothetical protein ATNIH1004_001817 [Aspergillus tanneri]THC93357.1 hypothetical protein EYZ11_007149 [Aspergillus tanneri]